MSDEHEHDEEPRGFAIPFSFFGGPPPSPEEIERHKLEALANGHEVKQFMQGLNEFQLNKVISLIKIVYSSPEASYYYIGVAAQILDSKHGKCMTCGNKHDEDLAAIAGDGGSVEPSGSLLKGTAPYDQAMAEYNMEQDDDGSDRVMCKNCGTWYVNLEDRMLRPPSKNGCAGCVEKEKWG